MRRHRIGHEINSLFRASRRFRHRREKSGDVDELARAGGHAALDRLVGESRVRLGIATRTHRTSAAAIRAPALKVRATSAGRD